MRTIEEKRRMKGRTVFLQSALLFFLLAVLAGCGGAGQLPEKSDTLESVEHGEASSQAEYSGAADDRQESSTSQVPSKESDGQDREAGLTVEFIDVGQGDATLIICEGKAMLIDAGDESAGTNVQNEMIKLGVEELDYFVCTHPDADHIGGADVIAYKFLVGKLLMPELERDTKAYERLADTIRERNIEVVHPAVGEEYSLGSANFTIVGPVKAYGRDETNDWSVCLRFTYGDTSFLFCGDAEEKAEEDMLAAGAGLEADVYHINHHGSSGSTSEAFLRAVDPTYAVVSCGRDNDYGHPHEETVEKLAACDVQLYRTDEQGNIFCYSDGKSLLWESEFEQDLDAAYEQDTEKNIAPDTASVVESNTVGEVSEREYILNTNTKKIHLPDCKSVAKMKKKNQRKVQAVLEDLLNDGYDPCQTCMG